MLATATRRAIIIGIDQYLYIEGLYGCRTDAEEMAQCLTLPPDDFDIELIVNSDATRSNILHSLGEQVYIDADPKLDILIIYFAGHGAIRGSSGYILTHDASEFDPGISLAQLADIMEAASDVYERVVLILGCCHAGAAHLGRGSLPIDRETINRDMPSRNSSKCIIGACTTDGFSFESDTLSSRGMFTDALVQGLLGDAVDFEGKVTALSLFEWVSNAMDLSKQVPVFKGDIAGTLTLRTGLQPRRGRPIRTDELITTLSKGRQLLDNYESLASRNLGRSEQRRDGGAMECSANLDGVVEWFEETQQNLPDLRRDEVWRNLEEELLNARKRLAEVSVGEITYAGELLERIGEGGYGQVWRAVDPSSGPSALKIFHGGELYDYQKVARFRNGFSNMRKLDHPHIVRVRELRSAPLSFTMDYIEGDDLSLAFLDPDDHVVKLKLLVDIAETLIHAHARDVKHRDIKPGNIIVANEGGHLVPYLTDFDLAYHETNRTLTENLGVGGVIHYAAPEQLYEPNKKAARQFAVDIYSFAQILFYVIVRHDPSGESIDSNSGELERALRDWSPSSAGQRLLELYVSSSTRDPEKRPQSMQEIHTILSSCLAKVARVDSKAKISVDELLEDCGHAYSGTFGFTVKDGELKTSSKSGRLDLVIAVSNEYKSEVVDFRIHLRDVSGYVLPGVSTQEARIALNKRVDRVLHNFGGCARERGKSGNYEAAISVRDIPRNTEGSGRLHTLIVELVAAIE